MDPVVLIARHYKRNPKAQKILLSHSEKVADKALAAAERVPDLEPDLEFIRQAALLHPFNGHTPTGLRRQSPICLPRCLGPRTA
jgi:hypothetical protein